MAPYRREMPQPLVPPPAPWPPPRPPAPDGSAAAVSVVAAGFAGLWMIGVAVLPQVGTWLVEQALEIAGVPLTGWAWLAVAWASAALAAVPAVLLAVLPRVPGVRAAGRAWLTGALAMGVLGSLRGIPRQHHELYLGLLALAAAALALALAWMRRYHPPRGLAGYRPARADGWLFGLAAGLVCLLPWVWLGAFGGLLETGLAAAAAVAVGLLAAAILDDGFWLPFSGAGRALLIVVGGLVAAVALTLTAAGTGASGVQLTTLLVLPPLGFAAAALQPARGRWPVAALVAAAVLGPLAFVDAEELSLLVNFDTRDVGFWAAVAAAAGLVLAVLTGVGYALGLVHGGRPLSLRVPRRAVAAVTAIAVATAAMLVYGVLGQPGLHGERVFVVMREQADLSGLAGIPDRAERLTATYRRLVEHAERTQAGVRAELRRLRLRFTPYYLVNGIEVDGGEAVRALLGRRRDVDRILLSPRLRPLPVPPPTNRGTDPPPDSLQWNVKAIRADQAWQALGVTGRGIVIGTSDSGVDGAHPALHDGFRGGDDSWFDPWNGTRAPVDHAGHGTHTIASAVGRAPDGTQPGRAPADAATRSAAAVGVAPGANWMGCVNLDRNLGNPARYLDCLQFMLAPFPYAGDPFRDGRPARAADVLTNSWGCPGQEGCDLGVFRPATAALAAAGIFVVVAAGNEGPRCGSVEDPPAPYPDVLSVGASDDRGQVAEFSSRGPAPDGSAKPDLVAPGAGVLSAMPGGTYGTLDGTSMATPHVAGVVALMWSANPRLVGDITRTRQILRDTARPPQAAAEGDADQACAAPDRYGAGIVDALGAVRAAQALR
jgi:hypothetical protein